MAKKEYIERGAVIESLHRIESELAYTEGKEEHLFAYGTLTGVRKSIIYTKSAPAADVVEVVRCKDCKNAYINSFSAQSGTAVCRFLANRSNGELAIVQQDNFCSYGERKEQE